MATSRPHSPPSDFPAKTKRTNQKEEDRKKVTYKTKEIKYLNRKKLIILQNENGPCPLIAICNVLLLRNRMDLYPDRFQVSQERLLNLVANILFDIDDEAEKIIDAINLLPRLAYGINVDIKFRSISDFERTPDLAIFDLLKIPLYHGWIFDPQDYETATAIGCKSYNDLMTGLVTLAETQTVMAPIGLDCGECSVDFSAALGTPSQCFSKTRSFADSTPTSAEHGRLARGDIEEEIALLQALRLSERENLGVELDTRRDSSSGGKSASGYSDVYWMSEDDSLVNSVGTASGSTSTPGSGNTCPKTRCDDQFSSKGSGDETDCVVGNNIDVGENICSPASSKMTSEALDHDHVPLYEDDKGVTIVGSPVCKGDSTPGQISPEGKDTNRLTPEEGEVIKRFLNNNASQLTFLGLFFLHEGLKEGELCVFFRNNHFYTMLKNDSALYNLVTDQGYLTERDLVWENLNQVNGDSDFVTGDFKVFEFDSGNWDQQDAVSNTADYIYSINSLSKEGMEIDPDLKMAMELQEQELGGEDKDFEVSIKRQSIQEVKAVQRKANVNIMYINPHVSSFLCTV
ncbi:hypothetical protein Rs2_46970 [Raphanus sativus]|uniref:Uncharacterized protein LOC108852599 n=1 Tax=Raphanus sativus TaxID=3726 RepID=A0A6J0NAT7_RAPSA|nr:uncharacterized protein LOC108852599 [Raphanus sativus]KAJ4871397.1 hypothetical protein Rs2_46970 [Raphanus sativus]